MDEWHTLKGLHVVLFQLGDSLKGDNDASERKDIKNFHFLHRTSLTTKAEIIEFLIKHILVKVVTQANKTGCLAAF